MEKDVPIMHLTFSGQTWALSPACLLFLRIALSWKELSHQHSLLKCCQNSGQENHFQHVGTNEVTLSHGPYLLARCTDLHNAVLTPVPPAVLDLSQLFLGFPWCFSQVLSH